MSTITTSPTIRTEGNTLFLKCSPAIGVLSLLSFTDDATGESGGVVFNRSFRYSRNGVTFTDWQPLTTPYISAATFDVTDTLCIELAFEKVQPLGEDLLHVTSATIGTTEAAFTEGEYFRGSIFYQFFQSNNPDALRWYVSVLQKLYEQGTLPPFISRKNEAGLPDDFVDYWKAICKFFSYLVNYARAYQNFNQDVYLTAEYLKQRGLTTHIANTLEQLNALMNAYYHEIAKRGTIDIIKNQTDPDEINGELLRLLYYVVTDEFLFNLYKPEHFGFCLGTSSPLYRGLYLNDNINKSYEQGFDILDLTKYPTIGTVAIASDEGHSTMSLSASGIGDSGISPNGGLKYIKIDSGIDYEVSFLIKKSNGTEPFANYLNFSCTPYDKDDNPLTCISVFDGSATNNFLVNSMLVRDDYYILVRGVIYNNTMVPALGRTMELNQGTDLILPVTATKIIPTITITAGTANIYAIRIMPLATPYSRGGLQVSNFISVWMKNNNGHNTFHQTEEFIKEKLIPYNAQLGAININDNYGVTSLPAALTLETLLYPLMKAASTSATLPATSGFYKYSFEYSSAFINVYDLVENYLSNNGVYYQSISDIIVGGTTSYFGSVVGLSMTDKVIPYQLPYTAEGEMLVWSDLTTAVNTATFKDVEANRAYTAPLIRLNATTNTVDDYMLANILVELVSSTPEMAVIRLTRSHPTPASTLFGQQAMTWLNDAVGGTPDPLDPTNPDKTILILSAGTYTFGVKTIYTGSTGLGFTFPMPSAFTMVVSVG